MNTQGKTSSKKPPRGPLLHRLNVRWPQLKFVAILVFAAIAILDLSGLTISRIDEPANRIKIAPMSHHVRATERSIEGKMVVALTFDDGPSAATTPRLLDILTEKDIPATFFMLGNMAKNNPDIVRRAERERHEVASHTMYHQNLVHISPSAVQADIDEVNSVFQSILGHTTSLTRPPYGNVDDTVRSITGTPLILWSVDTLDWKNKNTESIVSTAMSEIHDGAIILMHDIYPTSVDAIPTLVDAVRAAGYEFATVSELATKRGLNLSAGASYYNFRP